MLVERIRRVSTLSDSHALPGAERQRRPRPLADAGLHWILITLVACGLAFWAALVLLVVAVVG